MPKKTIFSGFFKRAEAFRGLPMFSKVTSFDPCGSLSAMIVRASSEVTRCIVKFSMNRLSGSIIEGHPTAESPTSDHCFKSRHEKCFCNIRKTIFDSHSTVHTVKCPFTLSAIDSRWKRLAIKKRKSWLRFEKLRLEYGSEKLIRNDSNSFGSRSSFASACDSAPHSGSDRSADLIRLAQFMAPLAVPSLYPAADSDLSAGRAVGLLRPTFFARASCCTWKKLFDAAAACSPPNCKNRRPYDFSSGEKQAIWFTVQNHRSPSALSPDLCFQKKVQPVSH